MSVIGHSLASWGTEGDVLVTRSLRSHYVWKVEAVPSLAKKELKFMMLLIQCSIGVMFVTDVC